MKFCRQGDSKGNEGEGACKAHSRDFVRRIGGEEAILEQIATTANGIHKITMK